MCDQQMFRSACAYAQSNQSICLSLEYDFKLQTEHYLEFLSLKGGCTSSSESTLVKMPHCWKSHVVAHLSASNEEPAQVQQNRRTERHNMTEKMLKNKNRKNIKHTVLRMGFSSPTSIHNNRKQVHPQIFQMRKSHLNWKRNSISSVI